MKRLVFILAIIASILTGCGGITAPVAPVPLTGVTAIASLPPTAQPQLTATPFALNTSDPYAKYTIPYLQSRAYGGGQVQVTGTPGQYSNFTRYLITYPSDGITIAGFMDVPNGLGPFPVIIALHGYVDPLAYRTLDYTTKYADALATAGFLVLHPNMRNFPPSGKGDDLFRVGMAIDVLNLIAIVKATAGQNGALQSADPQRIGLWGHGMGGAIATRVMTVSPDIRAVLLYSPVSGDEQKNYSTAGIWPKSQGGSPESAAPEQEMPLISPMYYYQHVQAAISVNQGLADPVIPVRWSQATCDQLQEMSKTVECHYYSAEGNLFAGNSDRSFMRIASAFFNEYLR